MRRQRVARWLVSALLAFGGRVAYAQSCVAASQVTLTGVMRGANGLPAANDTLTLQPTNTGYIAGCGVNVPTAITCATSVDGSVVGIGNPLQPTLATAQYVIGNVPAGSYFIQFTFYDGANHQTLPSPEFTVSLTAAGSINVNAPDSGLPSGAVGMDVYIGTASGGETLQGSTTGTATYTQSAPLSSGAALPSSNATLCQPIANDAQWPVGTGYTVSLTDAAGNATPRFQQQWQLNGPGTTINLSAGTPWYHGVVYYPSPLFSSPTNHGQQGITGPLSLNGYNLVNVGRLGVGTITPGYPLDVNGDLNLRGLFRLNGSYGVPGQCFISNGSGQPVWGSCVTGASYYQTMQANGVARTQRATLDFTSAFTVSDDSGGLRTVVGIANSTPTINTPSSVAVLALTVSGGAVSRCSVTSGGNGYDDTPLVAVNGDGIGASVTAVQSGGVITGCNVIAGGTGYNSASTTAAIEITGSATLPGGIIMQWASGATGQCGWDGRRQLVTFDSAFPHACLSVQVSTQVANNTTAGDVIFQPIGRCTTTGVMLSQQEMSDNCGGTNYTPQVLAIGW